MEGRTDKCGTAQELKVVDNTLKPIINGGRVLILDSLKTHASYFDLLFINFINFGVTSNLRRLFLRRYEYRNCIKTQFFVLSCVLLLLDGANTS